MAGYERFGGCRRRRARVCRLRPARITSAWCTKSSLNRPNGKRPSDPPHRDASVFLAGAASDPARDARLFADHDDHERARLHLAAAFTGSRRIEVGGREEDVVGFEVETHSAGRLLRGDILDNGIFVWGILVNDRKVAIAAGGEHVARRGIEGAVIRTIADVRSCDYLAVIRVHHGHYFIIADRE